MVKSHCYVRSHSSALRVWCGRNMTKNYALWKVRTGLRNLGSGNYISAGLRHLDIIKDVCALSALAVLRSKRKLLDMNTKKGV